MNCKFVMQENKVPGGNSGDFNGRSYFKCDPGHGLLMPYDKLKKDDRFSEEVKPALATVEETKVVSSISPEQHVSVDTIPGDDVLRRILTTLGTKGKVSGNKVNSKCC